MSSLITCRLYDQGVPATGLIPTIKIIQESDGSTIVDLDTMEEVSNGMYKYVFEGYSKSELYFFIIDGGPSLQTIDRYIDNINQQDSYGNKETRGRVSNLIINTKQLAKDVWSLKQKDVEKGTIGEHIWNLQSFSIEEFNTCMDLIDTKIKDNFGEMILKTGELISGIKFPKELKILDIIVPLEKIINATFDKNIEEFGNGLSYLEKMFKDNIENRLSDLQEGLKQEINNGKYDDENIQGQVILLSEQLNLIRDKISAIDRYEIIKLEKNDNDEIKGEMNESMVNIKTEMEEMNRKMKILFTRLNSN